MEELKQVSLI